MYTLVFNSFNTNSKWAKQLIISLEKQVKVMKNQLSFNKFCSEEKSKLSQPISEARAATFRSAQKTQMWSKTLIEVLLPVRFGWIPFREEVKRVSADHKYVIAVMFFQFARKTQKMVEDIEFLLPVKIRLKLISVSEKSKMPQPMEARAAILVFWSAQKAQI